MTQKENEQYQKEVLLKLPAGMACFLVEALIIADPIHNPNGGLSNAAIHVIDHIGAQMKAQTGKDLGEWRDWTAEVMKREAMGDGGVIFNGEMGEA